MEANQKRKILVVDDEVTIRNVVQMILERKQMEVMVAPNKETALKLLAENRFDVVLLDIKLGIESGLDVLRTLRDDLKSEAAVLMMSGLADTERLREASKYNIRGFVMKPFNAKALEEKVVACF